MDDETKKQMEALQSQVADLSAKVEETTKAKAELETTLAQERERAKERAGEFKRFREMTDEEKAKLSATERALAEQQEHLSKRQEEIEKMAKENQEKTVNALRDSYIKRVSGGDEKTAELVRFHYGRLADVADTPEAIEKKVIDALTLAKPGTQVDRSGFNFMGGFGGGDGAPQGGKGAGFGESSEGKDLAGRMGIKISNDNK